MDNNKNNMNEEEFDFSLDDILADAESELDLNVDEDSLDDVADIQGAAVKAKTRAQNGKMELYDWVQCIIFALIAGIMVFLFIGRQIQVVGPSMQNTLFTGDRVIVSNLFYTPEAGDIVVVQTDTFGGDPLIKRVIATAGQTVDIDFQLGIVYVDGVALEEDYIAEATFMRDDFQGEITVPEGHVFIMGDNRNQSTDSRSNKVGCVDVRRVIGKVLIIAIPGADLSGSASWSRFGSPY